MQEKVIRDSVLGYISIPNSYFEKFIDTDTFQRLRNVEQTSMRCLYPCARHDRFAHSIGTFYIGKMLIKALIKNIKKYNTDCYNAFTEKRWECIITSFEIACLLHDCAHSPFSHILEKYMDHRYDTAGKAGLLVDELTNNVGNQDEIFSNKDHLVSCTSNHEKASALLLWKRFKDDIIELGGEPIIAMRCIMGYMYTPASNIQEKVLNCIFSLLNGIYMDADKLDYIARDTFCSGINNFSVDLHRLINSVTVVESRHNKYAIGYLKTSINVIQNLIAAKNNLYLWIYAHHKVQYYANLLCICYEKAVSILFGYDIQRENEKILATCSNIISVEAMFSRTTINSFNNHYEEISYLPCDYDILVLIKKAFNLFPSDPDFVELFSRVYKKSVWKSYAEFKTLFNFSDNATKSMYANIASRSNEIINSLCVNFENIPLLSQKEAWAIFNVKAKLSTSLNSKIYVQFSDDYKNIEEYSRISNVENKELPSFFYLYHSGENLSEEQKERVVEIISSYST